MKTKYKIKLGLAVPLFLASFGYAQQEIITEEIFSLGMQLGSGARAIGMGGAFTAVGGDFSSSLWNPAGLRDIKNVQVYGSLSHLARTNAFDLTTGTNGFSPSGRENEENFTKFNDIGVAYPAPTIQGALVLAFGFNRVKSYDSNFDFRTFNSTLGDSVNQSWRELERGSLNVWTAAGAIDVSPNMSVGLGLNFWSGGTDFQSTFSEFDRDDIYTFDTFTVDDGLNTDISGFNAKLGALFRVSPMLHLGATISTPTTLKVKEDFFTEVNQIDDGGILNEDASSLSEGVFEYKIRSPWAFAGGASVHLLNFVFSADLEYNDWTQIAYKTDPPFAEVSRNQANRNIRDNYRATTRVRVGGEFQTPVNGLSFRAGYFRDPSIFDNADQDEDKQFLSAGIGLRVDKQARLDIAYVHGFWKTFNSGLPETTDVSNYVEDIKTNNLFISLSLGM